MARANYLAITAPWDKWNTEYNIGSGEELTATTAGDLVIKEYNKAYPDKAFKGEVEVREQRTVDPGRFVYDCQKAAIMLNFKAEYNFEKGIADLFNG